MSNIRDVEKIVTRSAIGGQVLSAIHFGKEHIVLEHSTVQELVDDEIAVPFQPSNKLSGKQEPEPYDPQTDVDSIELGYVCIGIDGHRMITDSNGIVKTLPVEHKPTDTGLYKIMPFVVKPVDNDLTDSERAKFRLRKVLTIDGVNYAAYYLRKLDTMNVSSTMVLTSIDQGIKNQTPWKPSINNLRPTKPTVGYENDSSYISTISNVPLVFEEQDIIWFQEACQLLLGDANYSITEIGYCTAVDKPIVRQFPISGTQTPSTSIRSRNLKEVVATQIAFFVSTDLNLRVMNKRFTWTMDIGINEPLFSKNT